MVDLLAISSANSDREMPDQGAATWAKVVEILGRVHPADCTTLTCQRTECAHKKSSSMWWPVRWRDGVTTKRLADVAGVSMIGVDIDHVETSDEIGSIIERLAKLRFIIHASHSDRPGDRCVRIVFVTSREMTPSEYKRVRAAVVEMMNLPADARARDASRGYYVPSRPSDACHPTDDGTGYFFHAQDGTLINVEAMLALDTPDDDGERSAFVMPDFSGAPTVAQLDVAARILGEAWPAKRRNDAHLALCGGLARAAWPAELIADFIVRVSEIQDRNNGDRAKRLRDARATITKVSAGEHVRGWPSLVGQLGNDVVERAREALGMSSARAATATIDAMRAAQVARDGAPPSPPPTPPPAVTQVEVHASLRAAKKRLANSTKKSEQHESLLLGKVLQPLQRITDIAELARAAQVAALHAPLGTTPDQLLAEFDACFPGTFEFPGGRYEFMVSARDTAAKLKEQRHVDDALRKVLPEADALLQMNDKHALVTPLGKIVKLPQGPDETILYMSADAFRLTYCNQLVRKAGNDDDDVEYQDLANFWLKHIERRTYDRIGLWPPPLETPRGCLNLWRGFSVEPMPGNWSMMRDHIQNIIASGDPAIYEYIIRWTAWMFQNPHMRAEAVIAMRGREGIGKGFFGSTLYKIMRPHSVHVTRPQDFIGGNFNSHMQDAIFFYADECYWAGERSHEGTLKGLVTEATVWVEPKGVNKYAVDNRLHILISSNNDWVLPAGGDARRYVVTDVSDARMGDKLYFRALAAELDGGGREAMLHELLAMDLGDWHPREIVDSAALAEQKVMSLMPASAWIMELLEDAVLPIVDGQVAPYMALPGRWVHIKELREHAQQTNPKLKSVGDGVLIAAIKKIGAYSTQSNAPGRPRGWVFPPLADARAAWCAQNFQRTWPEDMPIPNGVRVPAAPLSSN